MRKWSSNVPEVLEEIPVEDRDGEASLRLDDSGVIRTIGLLWRPDLDTFGVSIVTPDLTHGSSKRKVLSSIARIYDPLGWLSPVTIRLKILMQELWKAKLDWDSPLPENLHKKWVSYCRDLELLKTFTIPRCIVPPHPSPTVFRYELHGFCDASGVAYSSCVYLRTIDVEGTNRVSLVAAKTKVAPVKKETTPRLELCGSVLLSKHMKTIQDSLALNFGVIRCWTDATTVLDWISSTSKLPVFVSNRLKIIHDLHPKERWGYVKTSENPADCASRGISSLSFIAHPLWRHGPPWLSTTDFPLDTQAMAVQMTDDSYVGSFISKCSSFPYMKKAIGRCIRLFKNMRVKPEDRVTGPLSLELLAASNDIIIRCVQGEAFADEIGRCKRKEQPRSSMKFLTPFLDDHLILRVGGRLENSSLDYNKKHPILLPQHHNVSERIVEFLHKSHLHAGPQLLLAIVREHFWIVRGPDVVRKIVRRCVTCHRHKPAPVQQIMGQLPSSRVTPARPFSQCGMDYAGPFKLCLRTGRKPTLVKSYVCLFVCMCTRAIHLEWVSDLTTPAFIAALTRFISRRGLPGELYSDGGLNFQGARNEMEEFQRLVQSQPHNDALSVYLNDKGIKYNFNPPYGPHHGGLWEAGVKSMKHHLKRVVDDRHLSIEEFVTLLAQVEGALNSRPLTQMSSDPNDFDVLTPGHFLIGSSLAALPQRDLTGTKLARLSRWQIVQQMFQHFWKRWQSEYLGRLMSRPKWYAPQQDLKIGTLVLMGDESLQWGPLKWKLARVSDVFPGPDGKTRVVDVTTPNGAVFRRPVVKLSPLPIYE